MWLDEPVRLFELRWRRNGATPRGVGIDTRIMVDDVDAMYRRATDNGVTIVHDIGNRPYGLRDFIIRDPDGFRLRFAALNLPFLRKNPATVISVIVSLGRSR